MVTEKEEEEEERIGMKITITITSMTMVIIMSILTEMMMKTTTKIGILTPSAGRRISESQALLPRPRNLAHFHSRSSHITLDLHHMVVLIIRYSIHQCHHRHHHHRKLFMPLSHLLFLHSLKTETPSREETRGGKDQNMKMRRMRRRKKMMAECVQS